MGKSIITTLDELNHHLLFGATVIDCNGMHWVSEDIDEGLQTFLFELASPFTVDYSNAVNKSIQDLLDEL